MVKAFTVKDLHDLIVILERKPEWKAELRRVLLGEEIVLLPQLVHELTESMKRAEGKLADLGEDHKRMEKRQEQMEKRQDDMEERLRSLERDVAYLKGSDRERFYRERATAIFGLWLDKGRDATELVARRLREAVKEGLVSPDEQFDALQADLLWLGEFDGRQILVTGEASWRVNKSDVERAAKRAEILRKVGFEAIPFVGGVEWSERAARATRELRVVGCRNGKADRKLMDELLGL